MLTDKFSRCEFEKLPLGSEASNQLHTELEAKIAEELHKAIDSKFKEVAQQLKELGHEFTEQKPEYDSEFASWNHEYLDEGNENYPRIWLHTQVGVMTGYTESEPVDLESFIKEHTEFFESSIRSGIEFYTKDEENS